MTHSRRESLKMIGIAAGAVAVTALSGGRVGLVPHLEAAAHAADPVARPLAGGDPSTVLARLLGQLTDRNPRIRAAVIEALGRADDFEAAGALGRAVTQGNRQEAAAYALAYVVRAR
jgi:hypothetical protein